MSTITLPINIDFKEWASQISIDLPNVEIPIPPDDVRNWKGWASQVVYSSNLINVPLPTDISYENSDDWKDWASYFVDSISLT
jgi:hypothetical protein